MVNCIISFAFWELTFLVWTTLEKQQRHWLVRYLKTPHLSFRIFSFHENNALHPRPPRPSMSPVHHQ